MNSPNDDGKKPDNMELLKQQAAACGPECGCHAPSRAGKWRWVIGVIVLIAAGVLVVRAVTKGNSESAQAATPAFATAAASEKSANASGSAGQTAETTVGKILAALSELNTVATDTTAVFIFLPGKEGKAGNSPSTPMRSAANTLESKIGAKCGLFTLKAGSPDYVEIAAQVSVPGVLVMVKGGGMVPVSGDITEAKLVQSFVAASRAGGCGPSGCGPSGCK